MHTTLDGILTDAQAQVRAQTGGVIPGLFAAGEVVGGIFGFDRLGGAGITNCLVRDASPAKGLLNVKAALKCRHGPHGALSKGLGGEPLMRQRIGPSVSAGRRRPSSPAEGQCFAL